MTAYSSTVTKRKARRMLNPVDQYCERMGPDLWAEPINAATNLAFIWRACGGSVSPGRTVPTRWLLVLSLVGDSDRCGISALPHLRQQVDHVWPRIIPIAVFTLAYTAFAIRRYLGLLAPGDSGVSLIFYLAAGG